MGNRELLPQALNLFKTANQIYSKWEVVNEYSGMSFEGVALAYYYMEKYDSAVVNFEKSLEVYRKVFGEVHQEVAVRYHNLAVACTSFGDYDKAIEYYEKAIQVKEKLSDPCQTQLPLSYRMLAQCYQYQARNDLAIKKHEKAIEIKKNCVHEDDPSFADNYNDLGAAYENQIVSLEYLKKAKTLYEAGPNPEKNVGYIKCLGNLAGVYREIGYFKEAEMLFVMALELKLKKFGESHSETAIAYNNLGNFYSNTAEPSLGIEYLKKAASLFIETAGENHPFLSAIFSNIGVAYSYLEDFEQAEHYQNLALNHRIRAAGPESLVAARSYHNIAGNLSKQGKDAEAIGFYHKAIGIFQKSSNDETSDMARHYIGLGVAHLNLNQPDSAAIAFEEAIQVFQKNAARSLPGVANGLTRLGMAHQKSKNFDRSEASFREAISILEKLEAPSDLKWTLERASNFYQDWYRFSKKTAALKNALQCSRQATSILDTLLKNISPADKSNLLSQSSGLFGGIVSINHLFYTLTDSIHYLTESFIFAERSKAFLLYEALRESDALRFADIPDSLLQQEYDLRVNIAYHDKKRQEKRAAAVPETDSALLDIGSKLFDLNRRYEVLKKRFETDYPKYFKAKYDLSTVSVAWVCDTLLRPGQTLIEYLVGDSAIYLFLLRPDTFLVREIQRDFPLEKWVETMTRDGIYGYHAKPRRQTEAAANTNYTVAARQLYQKLLAPVQDWLTPELIVIPDGPLGYLPFEALLTAAPKIENRFGGYPFLLRKHQISYCYSATLLQEMRQKNTRPATNSVIAFAPFADAAMDSIFVKPDSTDQIVGLIQRDGLTSLPASGAEAATVAKTWGGQALAGSEATAERFRIEAANHRILHLATHGKADDRQGDYAWLAFFSEENQFEKLYARDLYAMELNADLVVLSACETGIGRLQRGEGIISLARAFAYAGARSIVTTLWPVNDERTKTLMTLFYKNLRNGKMTKDAALQKAKSDFLEKYEAHPFFWSGFIGIGDMQAIR